MKIRVALIDDDESYVKRLLNYFQINYANKVEVYTFSDFKLFEEFYQNNSIHVVLVSEKMSIPREALSEKTAFAWLVTDNSIREWEGYSAVGKYQRAEFIFKEIQKLYGDIDGKVVLRGGAGGKVTLFTSFQGGVGTSTAAAAYALRLAMLGKRVIYLNLGSLEQAESFFRGEGNTGFSDVLIALKSNKGKISIKLDSILRRDKSGVSFFASSRNANDMLEMTLEDAELFLSSLTGMEDYDCIIIDLSMDFSPLGNLVMEKYANEIIILNDGSDIGNSKLIRAMEIVKVLQANDKKDILSKCRVLYNRYRAETGQKVQELPIETIGEIRNIEGIRPKQLADMLKENIAIARIER